MIGQRASDSGTLVSFDERALVIGGRRQLLISGEIHYPRVPEAEWAAVLSSAKAAGLNCIATYVFWNLHEESKGVYDFSGGKDVARFLALCGELGLHAIVRAGPYCCAEWNYGGLPFWLRDEPGLELRTWNAPYLRYTERYLCHLFAEIQPLLVTRGGPVVAVQLENEYANIAKRYQEHGDRYLAWILELGRSQGIDVPVVMCEGGARGALEAFNGFSINADRVADFRKRRAGQPLMWTELWSGWYDTWSREHHVRDARNIAYHLLRFVAAGGTAWNYYMWHGGTNFGRSSMYLQANSYDFDAPQDEWGRLTRKGAYLASLHSALHHGRELLLEGTRTDSGSHTVWSKDGKELQVAWDEAEGRAAISDERGKVLFDTEEGWESAARHRRGRAWRRLVTCEKWTWSPELLPSERAEQPITCSIPEDQLLWTKDESDYCWYSHSLRVRQAGTYRLHLPFCGDFLRIYVNGKPVAQTLPPMIECRGPTNPQRVQDATVNPLERSEPGYAQSFEIPLRAGRNRLDILCCALGLIKGDWMVSGPMTDERKGIWSDVFLDDKPLRGWEIRPGLAASRAKSTARRSRFLGWCETRFAVNRRLLSGGHDLRLDLSGWEKGVVFLNGRMLGRYWLVESNGYGPDKEGHEIDKHGLSVDRAGQPTQRYYRVPSSWLAQRNTLRLFEEGHPARPPRAGIDLRKVP